MIHATGQVGRPSLCHRHILDNWKLALGSWETSTKRRADCGQVCAQSDLTEKSFAVNEYQSNTVSVLNMEEV